MTLKVIDGRDAIKTDREEVLFMLREHISKIERGEINPNKGLIVLVDSDLDEFTMALDYRGRAVDTLGMMQVANTIILGDILG